jgi:phosphoglycolate phosphatase
MKRYNIKSVLFDLDGTLLDTEPDFIFAINQLLKNHQKAELIPGDLRTAVAYGSAEMIKCAFNITEDNSEFVTLREQLLSLYHENIARFTKPFDGISDVLNSLTERKLQWGIVTNKPGWLTTSLLKQISLSPAPACVISGDTLTNRKPHPEPLLHACNLLQSAPNECLYIGDTDIDILAANNADIPVLVAEYGYLALSQQNANHYKVAAFIKQPTEIIQWLDKFG